MEMRFVLVLVRVCGVFVVVGVCACDGYHLEDVGGVGGLGESGIGHWVMCVRTLALASAYMRPKINRQG